MYVSEVYIDEKDGVYSIYTEFGGGKNVTEKMSTKCFEKHLKECQAEFRQLKPDWDYYMCNGRYPYFRDGYDFINMPYLRAFMEGYEKFQES